MPDPQAPPDAPQRQRESTIEGSDVDLHLYITLLRSDVRFLLDQLAALTAAADRLRTQLEEVKQAGGNEGHRDQNAELLARVEPSVPGAAPIGSTASDSGVSIPLEISELNNRWNKMALSEAEAERKRRRGGDGDV